MARYRSVLPRIATTRTPEGTRLIAERDNWRVITLQTAAIAVLYLLLVWLMYFDGGMFKVMLFFIYLGVPIVMGLSWLWKKARQRRLGHAELVLDSWPLRLGDEVHACFRAGLRRGAPVSALVAKFKCFEEVKVDHGKYQRTEIEDLHAVFFDESTWRVENAEVVDEWTLQLPSHLPPSLNVPWNRVVWQLSTTIESTGLDLTADFELLVVPEVVE